MPLPSTSSSSSPRTERHHRWLTYSTVSDISMSDVGDDLPMDYSESEDEGGSPRYPTGPSSFRLRSDSMSKSSRVMRFQHAQSSSSTLLEQHQQQQQQPDDHHHDHHDADDEEMATPPPPKTLPSRQRKKTIWNAVSNLALNIHRSPAYSKRPTRASRLREYPPRVMDHHHDDNDDDNGHSTKPFRDFTNTTEQTPLVVVAVKKRNATSSSSSSSPLKRSSVLPNDRAIQIAACFLQDFERGARPVLPADLTKITNQMLSLRVWKQSLLWQILVHLAIIALFVSSCWEGDSPKWKCHLLNCYAILIFVVDMVMGSELRKHQQQQTTYAAAAAAFEEDEYQQQADPILHLRRSRIEQWTVPLMVFLMLLSVEMILTVGDERRAMWSSILKPIPLFYVSKKAKNALEALNRIARIVTRVLIMELFLILSFAAVACRLYSNYDSFRDLSTAFLSLFELSTTVVNPSMWMPIYNASKSSAFFFVFFVVTSVFYLHSLVLSVVFQTYIQAATDIHDRSMSDREDAMRLAFLALQNLNQPSTTIEQPDGMEAQVVKVDNVRDTLTLLRPHYNAMKINALVEIVDPSNEGVMDYPSFRTKIRQALNASIRSARTESTFSVIVELTAACVAVSNFIYVMMLTSAFHADWFDVITYPAGCAITLLGMFELIARFNHVRLFNFTPITRLNSTFDGLASVAAMISFQGIFNYITGRDLALELLLIGRAVDMIRIMRFFSIFRDVVRRSGDVFPALAGPVALVVSAVHIFTYIGMALWGGAIEVGTYGDLITPLYDLNNFNSYSEGLVTMFQVLVVNDWHAVANVFLYATRCSKPPIVYTFFIGANLIGVSIMLNCLTAFFVGAFVTKLNDDVDSSEDAVTTTQKPQDLSIEHVSRFSKRIFSQRHYEQEEEDVTSFASHDLHEFDIYEREGYDKIMRTVAGGGEAEEDLAKEVCDVLEVFESLSPGRPKLGYMVCCQQTMSRFGNRRFQTSARHYVSENALYMVVSDMHSELLALSRTHHDRTLLREFHHLRDSSKKLELSAALVRQQPAVSLFVSRVIVTP